MPRYKTN